MRVSHRANPIKLGFCNPNHMAKFVTLQNQSNCQIHPLATSITLQSQSHCKSNHIEIPISFTTQSHCKLNQSYCNILQVTCNQSHELQSVTRMAINHTAILTSVTLHNQSHFKIYHIAESINRTAVSIWWHSITWIASNHNQHITIHHNAKYRI